MKVLVTGSRYWCTDEHIKCVYDELSALPKGTIVVHGAAPGVDTIAQAVADTLGLITRSYPADWNAHLRSAGPIRNRLMLETEHTIDEPIDTIIAFHDHLEKSKGTKHMLMISGVLCITRILNDGKTRKEL